MTEESLPSRSLCDVRNFCLTNMINWSRGPGNDRLSGLLQNANFKPEPAKFDINTKVCRMLLFNNAMPKSIRRIPEKALPC